MEDASTRPADPAAETAATTDFETAHRQAFDAAGVEVTSHHLELEGPDVRIHVSEAGEGTDDPPLLFVHGVLGYGAMFAPLVGRLPGTHRLVLDRPGWGLSGDYRYAASTHARVAVDVLDGVLDAFDLDAVDLVGHSTGGHWSLRYALARPGRVRRVIAVGGVPAIPGTSPPIPLRLYTVPGLPRLLTPRGYPSEETVVKQLSIVGESETIRDYPALIHARVAHDRQSRVLPVGVSELRSFTTLRRWRRSMQLSVEAVRSVEAPTTFVWGEEDLLGPPEDVQSLVASMPAARLVAVSGGHIPWYGHPDTCAEVVSPD